MSWMAGWGYRYVASEDIVMSWKGLFCRRKVFAMERVIVVFGKDKCFLAEFWSCRTSSRALASLYCPAHMQAGNICIAGNTCM